MSVLCINTLFNKTLDVLTVTTTQDASGGSSETTTPKHSTVPCRMRTLSGVESKVLGAEGRITIHRFYTLADITVLVKDIIDFESRQFDVEFVNNPHELDEFLQIDAVERE